MATKNSIDSNIPIEVSKGGTGASSLTSNGVLVGGGTGAVVALTAASTGQTLMGNTGSNPSFTASPTFGGTVTATTGLTVPTGSGSTSLQSNSISVSTDTTSAVINLGTGAASKSVSLGSTNSTSSTTIRSGSGTLSLASTNGTLTVNSGTGTLSVSNDSSAASVNFGTGPAVKTVVVGSTNTTSVTTVDCGTGGCNVGTSANAHTTTVGSTTSTSATTVQSGSGALNVTSTNGALTVNSGTGTLSVSSDASANTVNIATGAAVKTLTIGSTNTTSVTALKYGTGGFSLASGTGNVITAVSGGSVAMPLQACVLARKTSTSTGVTGDGTPFTIVFDSAIKNTGSNYNTGTGTFTAPVTGMYFVSAQCLITDQVQITLATFKLVTSNRTYQWQQQVNIISADISTLVDMDAADTLTVTIQTTDTGGKTDDVNGDATSMNTCLSVYLLPA